VEDHKVVADGLALLLEDDPLIEVVGCPATGTEAIAAAQTNAPDVVLLDYRLPDQSGAEVAAAIKMDSPDSAIVFLSADDSEGAMLAAVRAGGCGYLVKTEAGSKVIDAVHRAARGEMLIAASELARLIRSEMQARGELATYSEPLTRRQLEVLSLMGEGLSNKAIAARLALRPHTVAWHVQAVLQKLEAHSKLEAVARATERGLLARTPEHSA
jgi:DNA-binding NarL/FixJ family response regulator